MSDQAPPRPLDLSTRWARRLAAAGFPEWLGHLAFVLAVLAALAVLLFLGAVAVTLAVALLGADPSDYQVQRNLGAALFALVGFGLAGWRTAVADRQSRAAAAQAETALSTNITSRINEAVRMLGATQAVKVRRRSVEWQATDPEGNVVEGTRRHAWEYEGEGPPLPRWYVPVDPEARDKGEFRDAEKSRPVIEIRLGALYALERIAQDSERDHIPIMETLCAFVRENAPARDAPSLVLPMVNRHVGDVNEGGAREGRLDLELVKTALRSRLGRIRPPRADIQTALTVIGRRSQERRNYETFAQAGYRLNLRETNLLRTDLSDAHLENALLEAAILGRARLARSHLRHASLDWADLSEAALGFADLRGASLYRTCLTGAFLLETRLDGTVLDRTRLDLASLDGASLEGAHLYKTRLEGAWLADASMDGALIEGVELRQASLFSTSLRGAYLSEISLAQTDWSNATLDGAALQSLEINGDSQLTPEQLANTFWDGSVSLPFAAPAGCGEPWRTRPLDRYAFLSRWRGWREARGLPWPPPGLALADLADTPATPPDAPLRDDEIAR